MTKKKKISEAELELRRNPINVFSCDACKSEKAMNFDEFKKHLSEVHHLTPEQMKGKKNMLCHLDGDYWFSWDYEWTLECGLKFHQHTMQARTKSMYL